MATEDADSAAAGHSAQGVGNTFVDTYYKVLLTTPDEAHKFYEDSSVVSRPGPDGVMTSVTTMQGIDAKILAMDYKGCKAEIVFVDAQNSYKEGVIVFVTGRLIGKDNVKRGFMQSFFLAPHARGYYVLNDVFRFIDVLEVSTPSEVSDAKENVGSVPSTPKQESAHAPSHLGQSPKSPAKVTSNGSETCDASDKKGSSDNKKGSIKDKKGSIDSNDSVVKEVVVSEQRPSSSHNDGHTVAAKSASNDQEDRQKMSYALMVAKESTGNSSVQIPTTVIVKASSNHYLDEEASASPKASSAVQSNNTPHNSKPLTEVKSIYIGNLPSDVTDKQLDLVLKKFGPIKKDGIQIRKYMADGFSYGFVEFVSSSSARSAIEAHNITIGSSEAYITEKRSNNQAGNGRGKFPSGKGEFRNDNYRNRENFSDDRSYGRYQNGNRGGDFPGQARGPAGGNRGQNGNRGGELLGQARGPTGGQNGNRSGEYSAQARGPTGGNREGGGRPHSSGSK